ncbi:MAG: hypothetical protein PHV82_16675 [Victivallaceae bacterium]|nr:hypothetical protein [Victivallaceae bacterium]
MEQLELRIPTSTVNRVLYDAFERVSPPVTGRSPLRFYYALMAANEPPHFIMFVNEPKYCAANYLNYLKKALRSAFDFTGLPIIVTLRARPKKIASFHTEGRSARNKPGSKAAIAKFVRNKKKAEKEQERRKNKRNTSGKPGKRRKK